VRNLWRKGRTRKLPDFNVTSTTNNSQNHTEHERIKTNCSQIYVKHCNKIKKKGGGGMIPIPQPYCIIIDSKFKT
jgi:plasmid replication initiation protein